MVAPAARAAVPRLPRLPAVGLVLALPVLAAPAARTAPMHHVAPAHRPAQASRPVVATLSAAAGERTLTTLAANIGPGSRVTLTASVTTAARPAVPVADGTVRFYDNGARLPLGIAASHAGASAGTYTLSVTRPMSGLQRVVARYVPSADSSYLGSRSEAVFFREPATCRNCAGASASRAPAQDSADGVLSLSTPFTASSPLDLGTLSMNSSGTFYTASAWLDPDQSDVPAEGASPDPDFSGITVVDTQAANTPWTVSAVASDLTDGSQDSDGVINAQDVGLTSLTAVAVPGDPLTAADLTLVDQPAASPPVGPGDTGSQGLGGPAAHVIVSDATQADGTIGINGVITINAPTSTLPGLYVGTVTITAGN